METEHPPSTDDDGVKHCFALPKITSKRVPEGIYEQFDASRRGKKELKSSRDKDARHEP